MQVSLLPSLFLFLSLFFSCCTNGLVWDRPREEIRPRILQGDRDFLRHIDYSQGRLQDAEALDPGGTFNMARILGRLGMTEMEGRMLEAAADHSPEPWASAARLLFREHLREQGLYRRLQEEAERSLERESGDSRDWRAQRDLTAALYHQEKNRRALEELERWARREEEGERSGEWSGLDREEVEKWSAERRLMRAVLGYRLGRDWGRENLVRFFARGGSPMQLSRAWVFVQSRKDSDSFSDAETALMEGRYRLSQGEAEEAWTLLRKAMEAQAGWRLYPEMQTALRKAALAAGRKQMMAGAELFRDWAGRLFGTARGQAWENAGRLYRRAGAWERGAEAFLRSYEEGRELRISSRLKERRDHRGRGISEEDVRLWFYLDCAVQAEPGRAPELMGQYARLWEDLEWYEDLIADLTARMAGGERWEDLWLLYQGVKDYASPGGLDQMEWVLYRVLQEGLLPTEAGEAKSLEERWEQRILTRHRGAGAGPGYYYYLMEAWNSGGAEEGESSAGALGEMREEPPGEPRQGGGTVGAEEAVEAAEAARQEWEHPWAAEEIVDGFLDWGMTEEVAALVKEGQLADPESLRRLADLLAEEGDYYRSIRTAVQLFYREDTEPTREDWKRLYPRPYWSEVEALCREAGVSPWMVYGLLRRESLFHAEIVSSAGAVGLAQIMPDTGVWLAGKFASGFPGGGDAGELDLTDPGTSLYLGIHYLGDLKERLGDPVKALMAYNAGASRVRRWEVQYEDLPSDLLAEAIPFEETRGYVRAVLASAVIYGYLYGDKRIDETVRLFYSVGG